MLPETNEFKNLVENIKREIDAARYKASVVANGELIQLYWNVGKMLCENVTYGNSFIDNLAKELKLENPKLKGFSSRNLRYMKKFATEITDKDFLQTVSAKLPWSHTIVLLDKLSSIEERRWYGRKAIENGWSVNVLEFQIQGSLMTRDQSEHKIQNFADTLPSPQSELAIQTMKDTYLFDFFTFTEDMKERDIESQLVANITSFLLEMGNGFAYMGHQKKITVGDREFFPDLIFYNTILHCYFVIDLKVGEFQPEYAGKMNFYLSVIDNQVRRDGDNDSIGLILCRDKNQLIAEYSLKDMTKPIGVAEYKLTQDLPEELRRALPDIKEWQDHILPLADI